MNAPRGYGFNPSQLTRLRQDRKLNQRQLAMAVGLSRMAVVRYEQGMAEPRMDNVEAMARVLSVDPSVFFVWDDGPKPSKGTAPAVNQDPMQAFTQNLALLHQLDLSPLKALLEALTSSDNPLEYDQDLFDRDLAEFQQTTPNALPAVRKEFSFSLPEVAELSGLSVERLAEIEARYGIPVQPSEIMALRQALGVRFEPRAIVFRTSVLYPPKDRRSARAKHHESVQEWKKRCQRVPNKLDTILHQLAHLKMDVTRMEAKLSRPAPPE